MRGSRVGTCSDHSVRGGGWSDSGPWSGGLVVVMVEGMVVVVVVVLIIGRRSGVDVYVCDGECTYNGVSGR